MYTFGELRRKADHQLSAEAYEEALLTFLRIVELRPDDLDARLRVGDCLLRLGDKDAAVTVYTELARHAARGGYPLRSIVALKLLEDLGAMPEVLVRDVASLYGSDSPHIGRGVRRAPPDPNTPLPPGWADYTAPGVSLRRSAVAVASRYPRGALHYPDRLIPIPLLSLLPSGQFARMLEAVHLRRMSPNDTIISQGDDGRNFYVMARGRARVYRTDETGRQVPLASLHEGAVCGEMGLLTAEPRSATVAGDTDCDVLEFDGDILRERSYSMVSLRGALSQFARQRLLQNVMATSGLFRPLDARQRVDLMRRFVCTAVKPGTVLIAEGQPGTGLYVLVRGGVVVTKAGMVLAHLGPGDTFGEISLLNAEPTIATVTTEGPTDVLYLAKQYFELLVNAVPEIREYLLEIGKERELAAENHVVLEMPAAGSESVYEVEVLL